MSLINTIVNCRRPIAHGYAREVYYSKKYDILIKKDNLFLNVSQQQNKYEYSVAKN